MIRNQMTKKKIWKSMRLDEQKISLYVVVVVNVFVV